MSNNSVHEVFDDQWLCQNWLLQDNIPPPFSYDPYFDIPEYESNSWPVDAHHDRPPESGFLEVHMSNWDEPQEVPPMQINHSGSAYPWSPSNNFVAPSFMQNSEIHPEPSRPPPDPFPRKRRRSASSSISNSVASSTSGGNDRPRAATATRIETRQHGKPRKAKSSSRRASAPNTGSATASAYSSRLPHHEQGNNSNSKRSSSNSALGVHQPSRPVFQHPGRSQLNDAPCSNTISPENPPTGTAAELAVIESSIRTPHAKAEERYRECMRAMFRRLRAVLPSSGGSAGGADALTAVQILPPESSLINTQERGDSEQPPSPAPPSKLTKAGVIALAIEYIQQMECEKACMQDCYNRVVEENCKLSRRISQVGEREGKGWRQLGMVPDIPV